jgi:transcriptional regulator with XRE-family HTH domain
MTALFDAIRREREWIGFSLARVALAVGIPEAEYAAYESGEAVPDGERLDLIAYVLGTTVARLHGEALQGDRLQELREVRSAGHPSTREGR